MSSGPGSAAERVYVQSMLDLADHRLDRARAEMLADLDVLRDDAATRWADQIQASQDRIAAMRADTARFLRGDDEPSPTQDVGQGLGAFAPEPAPAPGPGPGRPINQHAAELEAIEEAEEAEEAERIRDMPMGEYAAERQRLIRADRGIF